MNFVALAVISEIDNMFSEAIVDPHMKKYIEDNPEEYKPLYINRNINFWDRSCGNKCQYILYWFFDFNHIVWYFYFFPFLCVILNFYLKGAVNCEGIGENE